MARRRKHGARTRSGRLSRAFATACRYLGTDEAQRHRSALVNSADPALAGHPISILFANGHLEAEQTSLACASPGSGDQLRRRRA